MKREENTITILEIDRIELGKRLEEARKKKGLTQTEAGNRIGVTRQTILSMEKGERPFVENDIRQLADYYECKINDLIAHKKTTPAKEEEEEETVLTGKIWNSLREEAREKGILPEEFEQATELYKKFANACSRLDECNGTLPRRNFPPQRDFPHRKFSDTLLTETLAIQERYRLGLGEQPVADWRSFLEVEVGIRCFHANLAPGLAGLFVYRDKLGGIVLTNRNQGAEQCLWTLVRSYAGMLQDRYRTGIFYTEPPEKPSAKERFTERFAFWFLMPTAALLRQYYSIMEINKDFLIADLFQMARNFQVLPETLAQRLGRQFLFFRDAADRLKKQRKPSEAKKLEPHFSERFITLAVRAYREKDLEIGELAAILQTDMAGAEKIVEDWAIQTGLDHFNDIPNSFAPLRSLADREP